MLNKNVSALLVGIPHAAFERIEDPKKKALIYQYLHSVTEDPELLIKTGNQYRGRLLESSLNL